MGSLRRSAEAGLPEVSPPPNDDRERVEDEFVKGGKDTDHRGETSRFFSKEGMTDEGEAKFPMCNVERTGGSTDVNPDVAGLPESRVPWCLEYSE